MSGPSLLHQSPLTATDNVRPGRVLTGVAGTPFGAVEAADGTTPPLGISQLGQRFPVGSPSNDGFIAISGETLPYHGPGQRATALVGTAITSVIVPLVAYTDGTFGAGSVKPISFAGGQTTGIYPCAMPEDTATAGDFVHVAVLGAAFIHPALS